MRGPLTLTVNDGVRTVDVTGYAKDLRFKRTAWGGDWDLSVTLDVPRGFFTDLGAGSEVVLRSKSGLYVFSGTIDNPGASSGPSGDSYSLHAFGGATRLQAVRKALAPVYAMDEGWKRSSNSTKGAQTSEEEKNDGTPSLEGSWPKGYDIESGDIAEFIHRAFKAAGLPIGRVRAEVDSGRNSANYKLRIMTGTDAASLSSSGLASTDASTTASTLTAYISGGSIASGDDLAGLRAIRTGADITAGDKSHWFRFWDVIVRQVLKDKYGADITDAATYSGAGANTVYAHEVIADMLGRGMCPGLDMDKVTIGTATYKIDALDWLDGITFGDALAEPNLLVLEPDMHWEVYGDAANFSFDWQHNSPRYIFSRRDGGITLPGQEITLCNRVLVTYIDRRGRERSVAVVATDAPAGAEGSDGIRLTDVYTGLDYIRDTEPVDLPVGLGSPGNAARAGEKALGRNNQPPRAGTAAIRHPVRDLWQGCDVLPHDIMPGCVAVEMETGDDFRVTEVEYVDGDGACAVTLGEPVRTEAQDNARIARRQRRRRR